MYIKRDIEEKIMSRLDSDEILILKGPGQIGKSTLLKKIIKDIGKKEPAYYINLENQLNLEYLNDTPLNLFKIIPPENGKRQYIFIDEIQYLKDPSRFLKMLNDKYKGKLKLIVTMASTFYNNGRHRDSLMGQKRIYEITPLTFKEFLQSKNSSLNKFFSSEFDLKGERNTIPAIYRQEIDQYFYEYIKYGGYPAVVKESNSIEKQNILEELVNSYINHEIRKAGIRDMSRFFRLMKLLAERVGELLNMSELAQMLGLSSPTIEAYVNLLQRNMRIKTIQPYSRRYTKEISRMTKFYFCDLGIRNAILNNFDNIPDRWDRERYFENIVFNFLRTRDDIKTLHFWRTQSKHEVDFIINEQFAFDARFNGNALSKNKFKTFQKLYPEIDLKFITYDQTAENHLGILEI